MIGLVGRKVGMTRIFNEDGGSVIKENAFQIFTTRDSGGSKKR